MASERLNLGCILVEGVDANRAGFIENEVRRLLLPLTNFDSELPQSIHLNVIVTDNFERHIQSGGTASANAIDESDRGGVRVTVDSGCTLFPTPGGASFEYTALVNCQPWKNDLPESMVFRTYLLGFVLGTVVNRCRTDSTVDSGSQDQLSGYSASLRRSASALYELITPLELADRYCRACLQNEHGNQISPFGYLSPAYFDAASQLLAQLCVFTTLDVQIYRVFTIGLEDLPTASTQLVGELMQVLVYLAVMYAAEGVFDSLQGDLRSLPGYVAYVQEAWPILLDGLTAKSREDGILKLCDATETIIKQLGLQIEDRPENALYVHVHEPVLCPWWEDPT